MNTSYPALGVTSPTKMPRPSRGLLMEHFKIDSFGRLCDLQEHPVGRPNVRTGYLQVWVGHKNCYVHHILYIMSHGSIPAGRKVKIHGDKASVTVKSVSLVF